MRKLASFVTVGLVVAVLQAAPLPAEAASAAVVSPPDGTALSTTETVLTAAYDVVAGTSSRLTVRNASDNSLVACADEVLFGAGMQVLRCHVRDLVPGHAYKASAVLRDSTNQVLRVDPWTFTVDTPVASASWPAGGSTVAGTADDPAPGPGRPLTRSYDRALDPATTTARLFASAAGQRTAVGATTTIADSTLSVEPDEILGSGQYSLVIHATDASGAASVETIDFLVGAADTFPPAPEVVTPSRATPVPESVTTRLPTGHIAGLVVYDPSHPGVLRKLDPVPAVYCQVSVSGKACASSVLPVGDLPPGTYAWYSYARSPHGLTTSGPDHEVTVTPAAQAPVTSLAATAPTTPTDPPVVHVTGTTDAAAVVVTAVSGASTSVVVEPQAGVLDVALPAMQLRDGDVLVTAGAVDALGRGASPATTTATKESVPLTVYGADPRPATGPLGTMQVFLNEYVRPESTLVVRDAQGVVVPGTTAVPAGSQLFFTPQHALTTQMYTIEVKAYAASCTAADLSSCEQVDTVVHQPVDATAPLPPSSVVVDPRLPLPTAPVTVSGRGTPGDVIALSLSTDGSEVWSTQLGAADAAGTTPFSTGPLDLSSYPHALLPVTFTTYDAVRNVTTTHAGYVDRRYPTSLGATAGPLGIPWGTTSTVSGRLTKYGGAALPGKALTIVQRRDNGTTAKVGSATTAADGTFKSPLVLTASGPLQVQWAGAADLRPAVAPWTSRVAVAPKGSTPSDHPDTPNGARAASASPQGVWLTETLRSSTDVDWYAFGVARAGYHYVRLGHLPADYAITLYDRGGNRLGVSAHPGRQFEEMYRYLPAGTYYVRVSVSHGYSTTVPYHLSFGRIADGLVILSRHLNGPEQQLVVEMMNNTSDWVQPILDVDCVTSSGRVVRDQNWWGASILGPRARGPLDAIVEPCPSGSSLRVGTLIATTSRRNPAGSWRLTPHTPTTSRWFRTYPMTVTNTGTTVLRSMVLGVVEYDAEGRVQGFGALGQEPLSAGASRYVSNIAISRSSPTPNRYVYYAAFF